MLTPPTFSEIIAEQTLGTLAQYREIVGRAASGCTLGKDESRKAIKALRTLELPEWCFVRDVRATRQWWATDDDSRRRELLVVFPHLFSEPRQWVELRQADRVRRRTLLAQVRRATTRAKPWPQ